MNRTTRQTANTRILLNYHRLGTHSAANVVAAGFLERVRCRGGSLFSNKMKYERGRGEKTHFKHSSRLWITCWLEFVQVHLRLLLRAWVCGRHVPMWLLDLRRRFGLGLDCFLLLRLGRIKII